MHDPKTKTIAVEWCADDVLSVCPHLTEEQAFHVLETAYSEHDANVGINWNVLENWAEYLYPQSQN